MAEETRREEKDFNVDEALDRLEAINQKLEEKELSLQDSLTLYKEGTELAAKVKARLVGVEKELEIIGGEA
ncbi:MAG: exodeoxyribonuclease VII small subunit [Lachnospiraceae bacterium]|nr:exodeoxyribonuclease VII small subunit [Lachnospiraceae bacterium]